jgi:hypothetical protein
MAELVREEGKDQEPYLEEYRKYIVGWRRTEAMGYKDAGYTHVLVETRNDDLMCEGCKELTKSPIPVDEAIRDELLPRKCTNEVCRCWYRSDLKYLKD